MEANQRFQRQGEEVQHQALDLQPSFGLLLDPEKALNNDGQQNVQRDQKEQEGIQNVPNLLQPAFCPLILKGVLADQHLKACVGGYAEGGERNLVWAEGPVSQPGQNREEDDKYQAEVEHIAGRYHDCAADEVDLRMHFHVLDKSEEAHEHQEISQQLHQLLVRHSILDHIQCLERVIDDHCDGTLARRVFHAENPIDQRDEARHGRILTYEAIQEVLGAKSTKQHRQQAVIGYAAMRFHSAAADEDEQNPSVNENEESALEG
mmetsp:Transcript_47713/g.111708  ORF Transcript_47713/g.111708 Transcript_47713/m.111708 type:complete len:263 (-) Transcript_47713:704-1492(-)